MHTSCGPDYLPFGRMCSHLSSRNERLCLLLGFSKMYNPLCSSVAMIGSCLMHCIPESIPCGGRKFLVSSFRYLFRSVYHVRRTRLMYFEVLILFLLMLNEKIRLNILIRVGSDELKSDLK